MSPTAHARAALVESVATERASGKTWDDVANATGVSVRHARRLAAEYRNSPARLQSLDPIRVAEEAYSEYEGAIAELREVASTTSHDSARIGAIKARLAAKEAQIALLQSVGVLPHDLRRVGVEADMRIIIGEIIRVFRERGVPVEVQQEIAALLQER